MKWMPECFFSYFEKSASSTGWAATEPEPMRSFAEAAAGMAMTTRAADAAATSLRLTRLFLSGGRLGAGDSVTDLPDQVYRERNASRSVGKGEKVGKGPG